MQDTRQISTQTFNRFYDMEAKLIVLFREVARAESMGQSVFPISEIRLIFDGILGGES